MQCFWCKAKTLTPIATRKDGIDILKCEKCDLLMVSKTPDKINTLYNKLYFEKKDKNDSGYVSYFSDPISNLLGKFSLIKLLLREHNKIAHLDLGCADGSLIELMQLDGNYSCGLDISKSAIRICKSKNIEANVSNLKKINYKKSNFDVITAFDLIEHLNEPRKTLNEIYRVLKSNGTMIYSTLSVSKVSNKEYWFNNSLEHLIYYNQTVFQKMISEIFGDDNVFQIEVNINGANEIIGIAKKNNNIRGEISILQTIHNGKNLESESQNYYLSLLYSQLGNFEKAKSIIDKYLQKDKNKLFLIKFYKYIYQGKFDLAIRLGQENKISQPVTNGTFWQSFSKILEWSNSISKQKNFEVVKSLQNEIDRQKQKNKENEKEIVGLKQDILEKNLIYENLEFCYRQVVNSKKWKFIYKISNIFNKLFAKNSPQRKFIKLIYLPTKYTYILTRKIYNKIININKAIRIKTRNFLDKQKVFAIPVENKKWPNDKPLISVIVPCYNYGNYVNEAIGSVLNQTFQNFEIIVVDGGSNDEETIKTLKKIVLPEVKIYYRQGRHLVGDNRNYGIKLAQGKYICCLDADDKLKPTYLEKAVFLLETQNYDLVSTSIETFGLENKIYYQISHPTLSDMTSANHIATVAVFKKELWKKSKGYYDWGLGNDYVFEDWALWIKMSSVGARFYNIKEPLMLYRIHGKGSLSNNIKNRTNKDQSKEIIKKYKQNINTFSLIRSKILNKLIKYKIKNKFINIEINDEKQVLFSLPFTALGGADVIFNNLVKIFHNNKINSIITTTVDFNNSLHDTTSNYEVFTNNIYHLPRFTDSEFVQRCFIDYLIKSYKIKIIFLGGSQLFYNNLKYIKNEYPYIRIIDIQFNTDIHFRNAIQNKDYIDHIIAENQNVYDQFIKQYKIKTSQIDLISYGVDTSVLKPNTNKIQIPNPIPKDKFIISYIGRLSEEKNPEFIIKLAEKYKTNKKLFFIIAGPGLLFEKLNNQIKSLGLNNIYMPGTINSSEYLSFTDLLILPSILDGNPIVIKEAFSMGVPVVASNVGGIPYIIKHNKTGFICTINSISEFSSAINRALASPKLHRQMKLNCRSYATKYLDIKLVNKHFLKVFKRYL